MGEFREEFVLVDKASGVLDRLIASMEKLNASVDRMTLMYGMSMETMAKVSSATTTKIVGQNERVSQSYYEVGTSASRAGTQVAAGLSAAQLAGAKLVNGTDIVASSTDKATASVDKLGTTSSRTSGYLQHMFVRVVALSAAFFALRKMGELGHENIENEKLTAMLRARMGVGAANASIANMQSSPYFTLNEQAKGESAFLSNTQNPATLAKLMHVAQLMAITDPNSRGLENSTAALARFMETGVGRGLEAQYYLPKNLLADASFYAGSDKFTLKNGQPVGAKTNHPADIDKFADAIEHAFIKSGRGVDALNAALGTTAMRLQAVGTTLHNKFLAIVDQMLTAMLPALEKFSQWLGTADAGRAFESLGTALRDIGGLLPYLVQGFAFLADHLTAVVAGLAALAGLKFASWLLFNVSFLKFIGVLPTAAEGVTALTASLGALAIGLAAIIALCVTLKSLVDSIHYYLGGKEMKDIADSNQDVQALDDRRIRAARFRSLGVTEGDVVDQLVRAGKLPGQRGMTQAEASNSAWAFGQAAGNLLGPTGTGKYYSTASDDVIKAAEDQWYMAHNGIKYPKATPAGAAPYHELGTDNNPMSVKVKGSVNLALEDLKMLADVAQRQYIANVNHSTIVPQIHVHVGGDGSNISPKHIANAVRDVLIEGLGKKPALSHASPSPSGR
jgi:hypothetical protein